MRTKLVGYILCVFGVLQIAVASFGEDDDDGDFIDENMEPFVATNEWKQVKPGQAIPSGLHVKMDLSNGGKWAKLLDEENKSKNSALQLSPNSEQEEETNKQDPKKGSYSVDELKQALKKMKHEKKSQESVKSKFKSIDEIRKTFDDLDLHEESDVEVMKRLIGTLRLQTTDTKLKLTALQDLEYYVHQVDNAVDLFNIDGFGVVFNYLNGTDASLREEAAHVIGSAVQSNPKVQIQALNDGLLPVLLRHLSNPQEPTPVRKKCLYCLSALIRHFPYAQLKVFESGGFTTLNNLFHQPVGEQVQVKIIKLIYDLVMERQTTTLQDEESDEKMEKLQQYRKLPLSNLINDLGWCEIIVDALHMKDHGARESALRAIVSLYPTCSKKFMRHGLMQTVSPLKGEYEGLWREEKNSGETDGYYGLLYELVNHVEELAKENVHKKNEL